MAYNGRYNNPDALPAHAEPEKTAAMPPRNSSRNDFYATKPPPPPPALPSSLRSALDDRYTRSGSPGEYKGPRAGSGGYDGYKEPQRHTNGRNNSYEERPRQEHRDSRSERSKYKSQQQGGYAQNRPAHTSRPSPSPRDHTREGLLPIFKAVDKDRSGQLSEEELGEALVNGDYSKFDPHTVKMMIRMFDVDHNGTMSFDEFCGLWGFLSAWRTLFDKFDVDRSNTISLNEFKSALLAFGYHLSPEYVQLLFSTYDTKKRGVLSFDLFVQSCISLKRMTDVFKKYDTDRDGFIVLRLVHIKPFYAF